LAPHVFKEVLQREGWWARITGEITPFVWRGVKAIGNWLALHKFLTDGQVAI
jgi:hypothetical protein